MTWFFIVSASPPYMHIQSTHTPLTWVTHTHTHINSPPPCVSRLLLTLLLLTRGAFKVHEFGESLPTAPACCLIDGARDEHWVPAEGVCLCVSVCVCVCVCVCVNILFTPPAHSNMTFHQGSFSPRSFIRSDLQSRAVATETGSNFGV